jgi:hypothetical protein
LQLVRLEDGSRVSLASRLAQQAPGRPMVLNFGSYS